MVTVASELVEWIPMKSFRCSLEEEVECQEVSVVAATHLLLAQEVIEEVVADSKVFLFENHHSEY